MAAANLDMRRISFRPRTPKTLHIETPDGIINIRCGLTDRAGRPVTAIEILADGTRLNDEAPAWIEGEQGETCRNVRIVTTR